VRMRYHSATLDRPLFMEAAARIEALEAALRKIAHPDNCLSWTEVERIAHAALDKDAEQ
jgi:hypothetical protein